MAEGPPLRKMARGTIGMGIDAVGKGTCGTNNLELIKLLEFFHNRDTLPDEITGLLASSEKDRDGVPRR